MPDTCLELREDAGKPDCGTLNGSTEEGVWDPDLCLDPISELTKFWGAAYFFRSAASPNLFLRLPNIIKKYS